MRRGASVDLILLFDTTYLILGPFVSSWDRQAALGNRHNRRWDRVIPHRSTWGRYQFFNYGSEGYRFNSYWVRQSSKHLRRSLVSPTPRVVSKEVTGAWERLRFLSFARGESLPITARNAAAKTILREIQEQLSVPNQRGSHGAWGDDH